jgi:hypothetical protein
MKDKQPVSNDVPVAANEPTRILSKAHGDDVNAIVFNMKLIEKQNPTLANEIRKVADEVSKISPNDPPAHEEDQLMISEEFKKIAIKARGYSKQDNENNSDN